MSQTICKTPLRFKDDQLITMHDGAQILSVQIQHGQPILWAMVDKSQPGRTIRIEMVFTGSLVESADRRHLASLQDKNGLVWHVFERQNSPQEHLKAPLRPASEEPS